MPWIHLHISDKGMIKPCCIANINLGNINESSFEEIWHGEAINQLRSKFQEGQPDKRCFTCINREKAGVKSLRQETFEKFPQVDVEKVKSPIYFDIRFSNVCNFKCRTCWHGASSKWYDDAKKLGRTASNSAIIKNIEDYNKFIHELGGALLNAEEIYFAGGEPLVTEEHYLLLNFLIENKRTDVFLRYNTNFSKLKFKEHDVLKLWGKFRRVEVLASVDDLNENGEYIRKGFNWNTFLLNREKIRELKQVDFKVSPTISILNVQELPNFYESLLANNIIKATDFYFNLLERPYYYNIKALPLEHKNKIEKEYQDFLTSTHLPDSIEEGFKSIIEFMNKEDLAEKHWGKFKSETEMLDKLWS